MEIVRKINDDLAIAGVVAFEQWQQIADEGFQSVLNLRSLNTPLLNTERQYVESLGLYYVNLLIDSTLEGMSIEIALNVLKLINELPKPILVCNNATLAAAMVLIYIAMRQGETLQQAIQRAEKLSLIKIPFQPLTDTLIPS